MPEADKSLKLHVELDVVGKDNIQAVSDTLGSARSAAADLSEVNESASSTGNDLADALRGINGMAAQGDGSLGAAAESIKKLGDNTADAGEKSLIAAEKEKQLGQIMDQLDGVTPGLGTAMNLLAVAYLKAGGAAEGGSVSVGSFNTALGGALRSLGPFTIAVLGIQAVMEYWDLYKEKVETAARAQEEATKRIVAATHEARTAVEGLNDALHPKDKDEAGQDKDNLKRKLRGVENAANRRRELDHASEEKELAGATNPEQQKQILEKYQLFEKQLEDWQARQKAAVEGSAVKDIQKQITTAEKARDEQINIQKKAFQDGKNADGILDALKNSKAQATTMVTGPEGIPYEVPDTTKIAAIDAQIAVAEKKRQDAQTAYEQATKEYNKINDVVGPLGELLRQLQAQQGDDASQAAYDSETNRQVYQTKGIDYLAPGVGDQAPGLDFNENKQIENLLPGVYSAESSHYQDGKAFDQTQLQTISALNTLLFKAHQNSQQILELIVDGVKKHETIEQIIEQVRAQIAATGNRQTG